MTVYNPDFHRFPPVDMPAPSHTERNDLASSKYNALEHITYFSVLAGKLLPALESLKSSVLDKPSLEILACVHISKIGLNRIRLYVTNLDKPKYVDISASIQAFPHPICIPYTLLFDLIKDIQGRLDFFQEVDDTLKIAGSTEFKWRSYYDKDGYEVFGAVKRLGGSEKLNGAALMPKPLGEWKTGYDNFQLNIKTFDHEEFPTLEIIETNYLAHIPQATLYQMFVEVFPSVSTDYHKQALQHINMTLSRYSLQLAATNSHHMTEITSRESVLSGRYETHQSLLFFDKKTMTALKKFLRTKKGEDTHIDIFHAESKEYGITGFVEFKKADGTSFRINENNALTFPDYHRIIKTNPDSATVYTDELIKAVKAVTKVADKKTGYPINLHINSGTPGDVRVIMESKERGKLEKMIDASATGNIEMFLNVKHLQDILGAKTGKIDELTLSFDRPGDPLRIDMNRGDFEAIYIVMPKKRDVLPKAVEPAPTQQPEPLPAMPYLPHDTTPLTTLHTDSPIPVIEHITESKPVDIPVRVGTSIIYRPIGTPAHPVHPIVKATSLIASVL
jgi:DNA polymerase III sliding clamp (beta) subunit (PCNA family)